ncbi:ribosome maturation factor RimM [Gammaproteobacteria bacterium]|nr:ribosome maturation factor RimM [Gammaproteobacteria bacterium]
MQPILVGKLGKTHGLLGCIRLFSYTQPPEQIFKYTLFDINHQPIKFNKPKDAGAYFLVKLPKIDSIDEASALVNLEIFISPDELPKTHQDEYYWNDLIGCEVINHDNFSFGTVAQMLNFGAQDILSIKNTQKKETLILFTDKHITHVDIPNKIIRVQWTSTQ